MITKPTTVEELKALLELIGRDKDTVWFRIGSRSYNVVAVRNAEGGCELIVEVEE